MTGVPSSPAARRALLGRRLRERVAARGHPLSHAQRRLWILDRFHPASSAYVVPLVYRIDGPLDAAVLERALSEVVRRHEVLRTVYRTVSGVPRQFVRPAEPVRIAVEAPARDAEADRLVAREARRPFDLTVDPMIRALLLRLAPDRHRLCLTLHHIACDGWSLDLLERELSACYGAWLTGGEPELPPLTEQYADFAAGQAAGLDDEPTLRALDHFLNRLAGAPVRSALRTDHPRPATLDLAGGHLEFAVAPEVARRVGELARACGATPFAVLLAAFLVLVRGHGAGPEVVVGSPVISRPRESLRHLIGPFGNVVVQRFELSDAPAFRELVERARDESRAAFAHHDLPFDRLVEELNPPRDPAYHPIFQLMFGHHERGSAGLALPRCRVRMTVGETSTAKFDLSLNLTSARGRLSARLEYRTGLFERETARALGERFRAVLTAAVEDPEQSVGDLVRGARRQEKPSGEGAFP
ncbi:condensation domain-containing protein [Actinoallomurus acaciae]|uniref:Condensation domain-containing protein n=1 Tax=Actinoallomurus acaciae TaxID=502577 RepID=A0ABV5YME1_9ACTN